ncbi:MAG: acyl-CoA/acyl-ACP dehydrogenase [Deltaproteobacteria bacterium]|nr:acyl-CoA/acyl-ACP dehydrogenase [Deltaproteobacteria bacterium]
MDFSFTEEQEILRDTAKRFIQNECGTEFVKQLVDGNREFTDEIWQKMVELGWTSILIPEEYDGLGLSFVDLSVILEEMGKGPLPGPFTSSVVLAGETIRLAENPQKAQHYLSRLGAGEIRGTLAWAEEGDLNMWDNINLSARVQGDAFILDGRKVFVPHADQADFVVCVALCEGETALFVVDIPCPGLKINKIDTLDRTTSLCLLDFGSTLIPRDALLAKGKSAETVLGSVLNRINVAYALDMVGGGQKVLDIGVEYAKTRIQFGQPIGAFQAIKHKAAELLMEIEGARSIVYYAAWAQDQEGTESTVSASAAKVFCTEMYRNVTKEVLQILGGIGFSWEHELHIFLKRAKCLGTLFGDVSFHREKLAVALNY